jgi:hypothetical protein
MGRLVAELLRLFRNHVPDQESHSQVSELTGACERWSAGHACFDEVRGRLLVAIEQDDETRGAQYSFEESCCKAIYNATEPPDPFDPSSPFFIVPAALDLANAVGIPAAEVAAVLRTSVE